MKYEVYEQLTYRHLTARNLMGLFKPILNLKGLMLGGRYTLRWLYAVGGQSIIFLAEDDANRLVVVKLALLPYHRPAYIGTDDIRQTRQNLTREASLLKTFRGTALPEFYDLIYASNPLHSTARGTEVINREPYLVMEFIQGRTLLDLSRSIFRADIPDINKLERLAWSVLDTVTDLSILTSERDNAFLYSDINPVNLMFSEPPNSRIRILDAGSLIPLFEQTDLKPHFTSSFVPKAYYDAHIKGQTLWPTKSYVMYTLGKTLWSVLTNKHPYPAEEPDLSNPILKNYSRPLRVIIRKLLEARFKNFFELKEAIEPSINKNPALKLDMESFFPPNLTETNFEKFVQPGKTVEVAYNENELLSEHIPLPRILRSSTLQPFLKKYKAGFRAIRMLRFCPDKQHIAIISNNMIEFIDINSLIPQHRFASSPLNSLASLDFDSTGKYFMTGSSDGLLLLWERSNAYPIWESKVDHMSGLVALNGSANVRAAITKWSAITFIQKDGKQIEKRFSGITDLCTSVAMAKSNPILGVGGFGGIRLWNLDSDAELMNIAMRKIVRHILISEEGQTLLALISDLKKSPNLSIAIWDIAAKTGREQLNLGRSSVCETKFDSVNNYVLIASSSGSIQIWDRKETSPYIYIEGVGRISSFDLSPDGKSLAIGTADGEVSLYSYEV